MLRTSYFSLATLIFFSTCILLMLCDLDIGFCKDLIWHLFRVTVLLSKNSLSLYGIGCCVVLLYQLQSIHRELVTLWQHQIRHHFDHLLDVAFLTFGGSPPLALCLFSGDAESDCSGNAQFKHIGEITTTSEGRVS